MISVWRITIPVISLTIAFQLASCTAASKPPVPDCSSNIIIVPTATRQTDPDLYSPPALPNSGDGVVYCPTPAATAVPVTDFTTGFAAADIVNLSLDESHQDVAATAVGDDMLAVAWIEAGEIVVALSRGGSHFQVRWVDSGRHVSLMFSQVNRLHVVYEQNGQICLRPRPSVKTVPSARALLVSSDPMFTRSSPQPQKHRLSPSSPFTKPAIRPLVRPFYALDGRI